MVKDLRQAVAAKVELLRKEVGDTVTLEEIGGVVERFLEAGAPEPSGLDRHIHQEIRGLLAYIKKAKAEIEAIEPHKIRTQDIPGATDELDAVVGATEDATDRILDAAEDMEKLAGQVDGDTAEKLKGVATKIYEASNFQDLTGQRITKVVNILQHIEGKIGELAEICGQEVAETEAAPLVRREKDGVQLHGPQDEDGANVQDDIDKIMAGMD